MAIKKVKIGFDINKAHITPGMAKHIRDTLAKNDISIDILGCYINLVHPDDSELNVLLNKFKFHINYYEINQININYYGNICIIRNKNII